jgi:hypothetical protein
MCAGGCFGHGRLGEFLLTFMNDNLFENSTLLPSFCSASVGAPNSLITSARGVPTFSTLRFLTT